MSAPVFPRRVLKAAGGLEHLSAQWSGEGGEGRSLAFLGPPRRFVAVVQQRLSQADMPRRDGVQVRASGASPGLSGRELKVGAYPCARHGSKSREEQEGRHDREVLARLDDGS